MRLLRFYYFSFLHHYRNRPESWIGEFRSLLLVELSICWLLLAIWLMFDPGINGLGPATKLVLLLVNIVILGLLYISLMYRGRYKAIEKEFVNHPINTEANRILCWVVWAATLTGFFIAASLQ